LALLTGLAVLNLDAIDLIIPEAGFAAPLEPLGAILDLGGRGMVLCLTGAPGFAVVLSFCSIDGVDEEDVEDDAIEDAISPLLLLLLLLPSLLDSVMDVLLGRTT